MKIKSLTIEGLHNVDKRTYSFEDLNYLYGENGAGKSTVLQAIQLALLGYIPGTSKSSKEALFRHANGRTLSVTLNLEGDEPIIVSRTWVKSNSSINSTVYIKPDGYDVKKIIEDIELPVFNFNEFVGMTSNKLKDWFIDFLPKSNVAIDWDKEFTDSVMTKHVRPETYQAEIEKLKEDLTTSVLSTSTGVEQIRRLNECIKSTLSFHKSELSRIESTIQSLIFYDDVDETYKEDEVLARIAELQKLQEQIRAAKAVQDKLAYVENVKNSFTDCKYSTVDQDPGYIECQAKLAESADSLKTLSKDLEVSSAKYQEVFASNGTIKESLHAIELECATSSVVLQQANMCPFTKAPCDKIEDAKATATAHLADLRKQETQLKKELSETTQKMNDLSSTIHAIEDKISEVKYNQKDVQNKLNYIQNRYAQKASVLAGLPEVTPIEMPDLNEADIKSELAVLLDAQIKIASNKNYKVMMDKMQASKLLVEEQIECYKAWDKLTGVNGLQSTVSASQPFLEFTSKMNTYIPEVFGEGTRADFNITSSANSFNFGILRGESYIPYDMLSSGEKCLFTLILLISIVSYSSSPLHLILVDDLFDHLDEYNIDKLFKMLKKVTEVQMIFAGVSGPVRGYVENTIQIGESKE